MPADFGRQPTERLPRRKVANRVSTRLRPLNTRISTTESLLSEKRTRVRRFFAASAGPRKTSFGGSVW